VLADFGTKINRRKRAIRLGPNIVKDIGLEGSDERNRIVIKIDNMGE